MKRRFSLGLLLLICIMIAGCSSSQPDVKFDIVGMWEDKDGTKRIFNENGTCQNVAKIDIGGPSPIYSISEKADDNGYFTLQVSQSGYNQTTFYVEVVSKDNIKIYEGQARGEPLYNLTRQ